MDRRVVIAGIAAVTAACGAEEFPPPTTKVNVTIQVDRTSCGITDLAEYDLPEQLTLSVGMVEPEFGTFADRACRTPLESSPRTLAELGLLAEDLNLATEGYYSDGFFAGVLLRLNVAIWSGMYESCTALDDSREDPILTGLSEPFDLLALAEQAEPMLTVPLACAAQ